MLYEWALLISLVFGNQSYVGVINHHNTKEDCIEAARELIGDSTFAERAQYSQITLACKFTGEKVEI